MGFDGVGGDECLFERGIKRVAGWKEAQDMMGERVLVSRGGGCRARVILGRKVHIEHSRDIVLDKEKIKYK